MNRAAIRGAVLEHIAAGVDARIDDEAFCALALEIFRFQYDHGDAYRRLCDAFSISKGDVADWREIPAVPTGAFKEARIATFPADQTVRVFCSSGTTTDKRGEHHLDTLALYDASLLATFRAYITAGDEPMRLFVLAANASEAPDSSLSYMYDLALRRLGTATSDFYVNASGWQPERLVADLRAADEPVAVVGTAFAFVHLVDHLDGARLALPAGSRVMETGGFKGRSRELSRDALHTAIGDTLGVPRSRIVNQYGMCELASQFYEDSLRTGIPTAAKSVPPWVRTRVVDPRTMRDVPAGGWGMLIHYDLANVSSVCAVQTSDEGRLVGPDRLEVRGRLAGAEARGCSIAADLLLGGARA